MGRSVKGFKDVRELVAGDYVVRYQVSDNRVYIVKIWHERENRD
jgi:toxin ParE1/3/4